MVIEDDELIDPDPEVPEMGTGEEEEILMPKNSNDLGFDETADPTEDGLKDKEEEEEMQ